MRVEKLLDRLKREFIKVNLLQASLDSILFFLSFNLVLFLFGFNVMEGVSNIVALAALSGIFLLGDLAYRARKYRLEIYEEKNPELREVLRTARDNLDQQNVVSQALFDDVMERARSVTSESIIPSKSIIQKIVAVGILSFLTVLSGITSFQVQQDGGDILPNVDQINDLVPGEQKEEEFQLRNSSEIYGDAKEIEPSDLEIDFNITGEGEAGEQETGAGASREELVLDVTSRSLNEDLDLARSYSVAVKQIKQ